MHILFNYNINYMNKYNQQGYNLIEAKNIINDYIDQSALRLQKRLNVEWKKQRKMKATLMKKFSYA